MKGTTKGQYIEALEAKKIGGLPRSIEIESLDLDSRQINAVAKVRAASERLIFCQFITFTKVRGKEWKIISIILSVEPVKK